MEKNLKNFHCASFKYFVHRGYILDYYFVSWTIVINDSFKFYYDEQIG